MNRKVFTKVTDLPGEEWRSIPGFLPNHMASNLGRIKRTYDHKETLYKLQNDVTGYKTVGLCLGSNESKIKRGVHTLVAAAWIPNSQNLPIVHHIDHDKHNNNISNLMWTTALGNAQAAREYLNNWALKGEDVHFAVLTESQVIEILDIFKKGGKVNISALARSYGVDHNTLNAIKRGITWKHLNNQDLTKNMTPKEKLTTEQVYQIKLLLKEGFGPTKIAQRFGVAKSLISMISLGKIWKHVTLKDEA